MTEASEKHQGGCLCGAVRYEIEGPLASSAHCHCRSCQKALGAAFATWAKVERSKFRVIRGEVATCETSPNVLRGFCRDCGTSLTYDTSAEIGGQDWLEDAWFSAATLDDPSIASPRAHVYVSHQQPWIYLADGLPRFSEF